MRKIIIMFLMVGFAYSINGTIVFYDGTTLDGEITASDTNSVFIIPNGLVLPEKIPVPDIESLTLENGITMVDNGVAKQSYQDGKFAAVEEDEPEPEKVCEDEPCSIVSDEPAPGGASDLERALNEEDPWMAQKNKET